MSVEAYKAAVAVITLLSERYPLCFSLLERRRRPLKLKIHIDLQAELNGIITETDLATALGIYVGNYWYLKATSKEGAERIDLTGAPAGCVSKEEASNAAQRLTHRMAQRRTKQKAQRKTNGAVSGLGPGGPKVKKDATPRISLSDLRAAAAARKAAQQQAGS